MDLGNTDLLVHGQDSNALLAAIGVDLGVQVLVDVFALRARTLGLDGDCITENALRREVLVVDAHADFLRQL